ncbi:hypothetical protein GCM10019017_40840 [Streptomyces showdoensis]
MEEGEVRDPAGQAVLERAVGRARRGGHGGPRRLRNGRSVRGKGNNGIDSGHFRRTRRTHGTRLSDLRVSCNSIANPQVILRRYPGIHIYTHM